MADPLARLQAALAGRYTIERELGRGGMATVYLARDEKHGRFVAVKVLRPELAATLGPERFLGEIQIAASLAHPHILTLHDSGTAAGLLYYIMPYVEGESLRDRLRREGRLPLDAAVQIASEVADALSYAHEHGVVHRDVKPENILLTERHAVVADFGIARAISAAAGSRLTGSGFAVGTRGYMSPEQAAQAPCDGRSDVYALGCVLYEMITGEPPLDQVRRLRTVRDSVPQALERAVERALEPSAADRFPTANEFRDALAAARRSRGARPAVTPRRLATAFVLGATLVAGAVVALRLNLGRADGRVRARRAALDGATTSAAAISAMLDGQARFWNGDLDGAAAAYRRALASDSDLALAYHRLSVVQTFQWDYPGALRTVQAGLSRRERFSLRWRLLLDAERQYVMRSADSAIAAFQGIVVDYPTMPDGWYGLGEALFHFGGLVGASPVDGRRVFERLAALDASFAPMYHHLVELALLQGDLKGARGFLARMRADDPERPAANAAVALSDADPVVRHTALLALRDADRTTLKLLVAHFGHGALDLALMDTIAAYLTQADRTPDDRLTGAQYRLIALAGQGKWRAAGAARDAVAGNAPFDRWMFHAYLAGFPAGPRTRPMLAWGRTQLATGQVPDFRRPVWEEPGQAFRALVHAAVLRGDSGTVLDLLRRLERAAAGADPSDPTPPALRAALAARLALLAGDTARATRALELSVSRSPEPFGMFFPLTTMAPERWLLVELALGRGDRAAAVRWLDSFANTWSLGDVLYARRARCVRERLARGAMHSDRDCPV